MRAAVSLYFNMNYDRLATVYNQTLYSNLYLVGLAFKQTSDSVVLFVVTTETVLSYNTSAKDRRVSIETTCTVIIGE